MNPQLVPPQPAKKSKTWIIIICTLVHSIVILVEPLKKVLKGVLGRDDLVFIEAVQHGLGRFQMVHAALLSRV